MSTLNTIVGLRITRPGLSDEQGEICRVVLGMRTGQGWNRSCAPRWSCHAIRGHPGEVHVDQVSEGERTDVEGGSSTHSPTSLLITIS